MKRVNKKTFDRFMRRTPKLFEHKYQKNGAIVIDYRFLFIPFSTQATEIHHHDGRVDYFIEDK